MDELFDIHELFIEGKDPHTSHVLLHISEPTEEDLHKGYFFALCELKYASIEQIEHVQTLIDDIEFGYYETDSGPTKHAFEATLEYMNRRTHTILSEDSEMEFHCFIGVIEGDNLLFSTHGAPYASVFFQKKQHWDTIELSTPDQPATTDDSLFGSVTEGVLSKHDYLIITNPAIFQYFTTDRFTKLVRDNPGDGVVNKMKKVLHNVRDDFSYGAIVLTKLKNFSEIAVPTASENVAAASAVSSQQSLSHMVDTQKNTARTLSPPLLSGIRESMHAVFHKTHESNTHRKKKRKQGNATNHRPRPNQTKSQESVVGMLLVALGKGLVLTGTALFRALQIVGYLLFHVLRDLFILITNQGNQRAVIVQRLRASIHNKKRFFQNLPMVSKLLLFLAIASCLLFAGSISYHNYAAAKRAEQETYTQTIAAIQDKYTAAESRLIYDDDASAFALLQEAQSLIETLPQESEEEIQKAQELKTQIEQKLADLRKVEEVAADTFVTIDEATALKGIEKIGDSFIVYGPDTTTYYEVNVNTAQITPKSQEATQGINVAATPKEEDKVVFLTKDNALVEYMADSASMSQKSIGYESENVSITDAMVYNRRLYTLDPQNNQIYKHTQTQTGYDKGQSWITDRVDITNSIALAIDGDIYVLSSDGTLQQFSRGVRNDFSITGLDPALESANDMWTYSDTPHLYILDQKQKRVVVINKTNGNLVQQYTSSNWTAPSSMYVDIAQKKLYVLDANNVYTLPMTHLN